MDTTNEIQNIAFREIWQDECLQLICGFANAQGGRIYLGVNAKREVTGVTDALKLMAELPSQIIDQLGVICQMNLHHHHLREYIELVVDASNVPVCYNGSYYLRTGSCTLPLKGGALQQFMMQKGGGTWESTICHQATLNDISEDAVRFFQRQAALSGRLPGSCQSESVEQTLRRLHVITPQGQLKLAALLLFGKDILQWCPTALFRIGRFGTGDADLISSDDISCPLILMPDTLLQILRNKYLISPIRFDGVQRREPLEIPAEALMEMLCNAVVHRDYQKPCIQMKVWHDRLTLWNPVELPLGFTPESLLANHESNPRNPLMAQAFYYAGYTENWGCGYAKIGEAFTKAQLALPTIQLIRGGIQIIVRREQFAACLENGTIVSQDEPQTPHAATHKNVPQPSENPVLQSALQNALQTDPQNVLQADSSQVPHHVPQLALFSETDEDLLHDNLDKWIERQIQSRPKVTAEILASEANVSSKTIKRHIAKIPYIKYIGSGYSGHWEILPKSEQ